MPSILLVDSDPDTREMYAEFMRAQGCTVRTAAKGDEALAIMGRQLPDLLVTEIALPGVDGIALCREIRARAAWRGLPILVLTAMAHPHYVARVRVAGANRVMLKPALPAEVSDQCHMIIERWPAVTRQAAALQRAAREVSARIDTGDARGPGDDWERAAVTTEEGTPIAAVLINRAGLYIGANRATSEITGFSRSEIVAKSVWDLLPAARREESRAVWRWFQDAGNLAGSVTLVPKSGVPQEMQYVALADVVAGAHLSVFVPHPFSR